jgi:3-keto-disaccharide hydrolase
MFSLCIKRPVLCCAALLVAASLVGAQPGESIKPSKTIVLFDGENLDAFYTYLEDSKFDDPKKVFSIRDGLLRISGEEWGGIATRDAYRDYHLVVEWKWGGPNLAPRDKATRDSGILVHGIGPDGAAGRKWLESIEYQIIEGGTGDFILVGGQGRPSLTVECREEPDGALYWRQGGKPVRRDQGRFNWFGRDPEWKDVLGFRGSQDVEKPVGEWNVSEVICDGDSITAVLNGVVVNKGTASSHRAGKIQIQSESAEILIRRVELRPAAESR